MHFRPLELEGAFVLELDRRQDDRGYFMRTFCADELQAQGLPSRIMQGNLSRTARRGTVRGMHWQEAPHEEIKIVQCVRGAMFDVIVDLRPSSPTFCRWVAQELRADDGLSIYVPEGFAHGFQTLEDDTLVSYAMSERYVREASRGARYDDPAFAIAWPLPEPTLSERDASHPPFDR